MGKIAERSRASKTLTVKQEIPSSNPGDFSMFDFQFLIFYNKQLKLFYLSGSLRNTQLSYLYFFTASVLHIHSLFIMYDVTNIKGYALKQVSKDPAGFKPTNSGSWGEHAAIWATALPAIHHFLFSFSFLLLINYNT